MLKILGLNPTAVRLVPCVIGVLIIIIILLSVSVDNDLH